MIRNNLLLDFRVCREKITPKSKDIKRNINKSESYSSTKVERINCMQTCDFPTLSSTKQLLM